MCSGGTIAAAMDCFKDMDWEYAAVLYNYLDYKFYYYFHHDYRVWLCNGLPVLYCWLLPTLSNGLEEATEEKEKAAVSAKYKKVTSLGVFILGMGKIRSAVVYTYWVRRKKAKGTDNLALCVANIGFSTSIFSIHKLYQSCSCDESLQWLPQRFYIWQQHHLTHCYTSS